MLHLFAFLSISVYSNMHLGICAQLCGIWSLCLWQQMGQPKEVNVVELGPGRGTLMADLLRVRHASFYIIWLQGKVINCHYHRLVKHVSNLSMC